MTISPLYSLVWTTGTFGDEQTGQADGFFEITAAVFAEVENDAGDAFFFHAANQTRAIERRARRGRSQRPELARRFEPVVSA